MLLFRPINSVGVRTELSGNHGPTSSFINTIIKSVSGMFCLFLLAVSVGYRSREVEYNGPGNRRSGLIPPEHADLLCEGRGGRRSYDRGGPVRELWCRISAAALPGRRVDFFENRRSWTPPEIKTMLKINLLGNCGLNWICYVSCALVFWEITLSMTSHPICNKSLTICTFHTCSTFISLLQQ